MDAINSNFVTASEWGKVNFIPWLRWPWGWRDLLS
jgi:hypothetical protein